MYSQTVDFLVAFWWYDRALWNEWC